MHFESSDIPRHRPGTSLEYRDDVTIIFDANQQELASLNESALAVWELCDGRTTIGEMTTALSEFFTDPSHSISAHVHGALESLVALRAVEVTSLTG